MAKPLTLELITDGSVGKPIFVAGNFNGWLPDLADYRMKRVAPGRYRFSFPVDYTPHFPLEYKYTLGSWSQTELDEDGHSRANRMLTAAGSKVSDYVPHWSAAESRPVEYFLPFHEVVSHAFDIPQLGRKRRINVLLPFDYHRNPSQRYPVLYMNDGQNLFNGGSAYGNWAIERKLAMLSARGKSVITVIIDHGEAERIKEFSPYSSRKYGPAEGKKYLQFICHTLKPQIDARYRTLTGREHTAMGGSSMGGLITLCAGLFHNDTFGGLMVFSPSLWIAPGLYADVRKVKRLDASRLYLYAGGREGASVMPNLYHLYDVLKARKEEEARVKIRLAYDPRGRHNESRWGKEFPKALDWLFFSGDDH